MDYNKKVLVMIEHILSQQYTTTNTKKIIISINDLIKKKLTETEIKNILANLENLNYLERTSYLDELIEAGICKNIDEATNTTEKYEIIEQQEKTMKKLVGIKPDYEKLLDYKIKLMQLADEGIKKDKIIKPKEPLIKLPPGTEWEDLTLKFMNKFDIEIEANEFHYKTNNEEMGFIKKNSKDKKPNVAWQFLLQSSVDKGKYDFSEIQKNTPKYEKCRKQKELTSKLLKECFGIKNDPFREDAKVTTYELRFKLEPDPELRGTGEFYKTKELLPPVNR